MSKLSISMYLLGSVKVKMMELSEAQVKRGVEDYLQYAMNQGKLWFCRLNAGDFIEVRGDTRRRIKGAPRGTADFIVIQGGQVHLEYKGKQQGPTAPVSFVTFIECKSTKGKLRKEQEEFAEQVRKLNCKYHIIRDADELPEVLSRE